MFKKFGYWPSHWGLKGKTREIAKAEYALTGMDLELRLLAINKDEYPNEEYQRKVLDIKYKYQVITYTEFQEENIKLINDDTQREIASTELEFRLRKITQSEYDKRIATINKTPYIAMLNVEPTKGNPKEVGFEFEWNSYWIDELKSNGYTGHGDE